jgi:tetrapyrrole methylase family protein/MazG family protein
MLEEAMRELVAIVARLRGEGGCPWDRAQTAESLRTYILEEAYEVVEAMDRGDPAKIKEELGDLLFQVVLQSQLASERGDFALADVARGLAEKIVRRHPHVFAAAAGEGPISAAEVERRWEERKQAERAGGGEQPLLAGLPAALPALTRAQKIQDRAARVGFDWERTGEVLEKIDEERREVTEALARGDQAAIEAEIGDLLFTAVNLARKAGKNAEDALRGATRRFEARFSRMEDAARRTGRRLADMRPAELDALWGEAKRDEWRSGPR